MKFLINLFATLCFFLLLMIFQERPIFNFWGINLNFLLLASMAQILIKKNFWLRLLIIFLASLVAFFWWPFWRLEIFLTLFVVGLAYFLKKFLTGHLFLDFLIFVFLGSILFYFLSFIFFPKPFSAPLFLKEIISQLILAVPIYGIIKIL